jgi:NADPH:quinone reductase-like Zn-dependent oxidoreductase
MGETEGDIAVRMNTLPKFLASRSLKEPLPWNGTLLQGELADEVAKLKQQPGQDILIYGSGALVNAVHPRGLIDECRLMVVPVTLGIGIQRKHAEGKSRKEALRCLKLRLPAASGNSSTPHGTHESRINPRHTYDLNPPPPSPPPRRQSCPASHQEPHPSSVAIVQVASVCALLLVREAAASLADRPRGPNAGGDEFYDATRFCESPIPIDSRPARRAPTGGHPMTTMQALVMQAVGEPVDVLRIESRPVPEPEAGQVRVRVQAAPIHATDLHILRGRYGFAPALPAVLGVECVGVVDALGDGVESVAVGQRVITVGMTGTWQQYVVADAARVLAVPDPMSASTAAQLLTNPLTALVLVTRELELRPGEWLLQTAAGSTVGKLVLQLGRHLEFKTINVVRRRSAVEGILELGGTEVICTEDEDLRERVADIAGEDGVRKAIDCVAGQLGADVSRSLAPGGEMVVYGALSSHRQAEAERLTLPLDARSLIYGTISVRGFWLYRWFTATPQQQIGAALAQTFKLVGDETIRIPEGQLVPLQHFADAVRLAEAPGRGGKPLLALPDA